MVPGTALLISVNIWPPVVKMLLSGDMTTTREDATVNLGLVRAVDAAWAAIRTTHPELPAVRLAVVPRGARRGRLGHAAWGGEGIPPEPAIYAPAERLDGTRLLGVVLHEAAHLLGAVRGIRTCSGSGNRHHSWAFARLAAETGLVPSEGRDEALGWDAPGPLACHHYRAQIARLDTALEAIR